MCIFYIGDNAINGVVDFREVDGGFVASIVKNGGFVEKVG